MQKVYGVSLRGRGRKAIIATTSWEKAAAALGISVGSARKFGSITGNAQEIALATAHPGVCFIRETDHSPFVSTTVSN